jgi:ABC-type transport system substrate-binding protein
VIRDELKKIGVTMDVVPLDPSALFDRILGSKDYEAVYFNPQKTDTDPGTNADFWLSSEVLTSGIRCNPNPPPIGNDGSTS